MQEQNNIIDAQKVLEAIESIKGDIASAKDDVASVKDDLASVLETVNFIKDNAATHDDIDRLDIRMDSLEAKMVTKDYLDDKLADLRGDLVVLTRKEDAKVRTLVEIMLGKQLISREEANKVLAMEPFPQLSL